MVIRILPVGPVGIKPGGAWMIQLPMNKQAPRLIGGTIKMRKITISELL